MITREEIRELAEFESKNGGAVSFYFQPSRPENKSHRGEVILVKDLVRDALRDLDRRNKNGFTRADLDGILALAEHLHGNHARAKAVFACAERNFWREYDLPPRLERTQLSVNRRFHLRPLAAVVQSAVPVCVALVDRTKARLFELREDEIIEQLGIFNELPRRGRSDGWGGYDAGHAERHVANDAMQHFKAVADAIKRAYERGQCERLIIGCRDEAWPEIEPHLHSYLKQRLVGRFRIDPATATPDEVRRHAEELLAEDETNRRQGLIREVIGEAQRNGRGALGLRQVLRSIENGEIQTLVLGRNFAARAIECPNCAHLDYRLVRNCAACGNTTVELDDVSDALVGIALRNGFDIAYVDDAEFERAGSIGALLRFRADQNTAERQTA
jgi:peptide subunit release factor 1 (eRF1)